MKRTFFLFVVICLCLVTFGQKKYEMVIEKTDATSVIIKTEDILRTYFRAIEESNQDEDVIDQNIFGIWDLIKEEGFEDGYNYSKDYKSRGALWYLEFCEDMTYTIYSKSRDEGPSQPGKWNTPKSGTFSMNADKKELTLVGDYKGKFEIIELTNSTLMIKETWGDGFYEIGTYNKVDKSVLPSDNNGSQSDLGLVGTWCYGVSEADALDNKETIEGYVFRADGTCTLFAFYNQLRNKSKMEGTYTYEDGILVITLETAYKWKNNQWERENFNSRTRRYNASISGNCMTWTGDDDETLYTREGLTVDLGDNGSHDKPSGNINLTQLLGKWVCYYQQWTQDGETTNSSYSKDEYIIELNPNYTGEIFAGKDQLFEWKAGNDGKTFSWTLSGSKIIATSNSTHIWEITSITNDELTLQWEDREANYIIIGKFKKNSIEGGDDTETSSDPEGTVAVECKSNTWLDLFDEAKYSIYCDKYIFDIDNAYVDVIDIGEVNGIGEITFPTDIWTTWKKAATQTVGHGYIFRYTGASTNIIKYAVVYIVSKSITSNMSYMIKYITPFELPDTDIITAGSYMEENRDNKNYFTLFVNGSYISWKHYVNDKVEQNSTVESGIKTDRDYIYLAYGDKIILSSYDGSAIISYKRNGKVVTIGSKNYIKLQQIVENH